MPTLRSVGIGAGLVTGASGVAGSVAYSLGAFHPSIQVSKLIKEGNKIILLSNKKNEDTEGWTTAWNSYKQNKVWGNINEESGKAVPTDFKNKCTSKVSEFVYGEDDPKFKNIIKFCARDKIISDVLKEKSITLLATSGVDDTWKGKFDNYKNSSNKMRLPNDEIRNSDEKNTAYSKLSKACEAAAKHKTTDPNYKNILAAVEKWCKAD